MKFNKLPRTNYGHYLVNNRLNCIGKNVICDRKEP